MRHAIILAALGAVLVTTAYAQNPGQWTASLRQVRDDRLSTPSDSMPGGRSFGTVVWKTGDTPEMSIVKLSFSTTGVERDLSWAILYGRCRSASLPVAPLSSFPELDMSGGGSATVSVTLSLDLPAKGLYHVEIYKNREGGEEAVVACGELKYSYKG